MNRTAYGSMTVLGETRPYGLLGLKGDIAGEDNETGVQLMLLRALGHVGQRSWRTMLSSHVCRASSRKRRSDRCDQVIVFMFDCFALSLCATSGSHPVQR
jgi:hypothetical protein